MSQVEDTPKIDRDSLPHYLWELLRGRCSAFTGANGLEAWRERHVHMSDATLRALLKRIHCLEEQVHMLSEGLTTPPNPIPADDLNDDF